MVRAPAAKAGGIIAMISLEVTLILPICYRLTLINIPYMNIKMSIAPPPKRVSVHE